MQTKNMPQKHLPSLTTSEAAVSLSEHDGVERVLIHIRQFDRYGLTAITAVHSMSPEEAITLAQRLLKTANKTG